jgi:hypothetical protein
MWAHHKGTAEIKQNSEGEVRVNWRANPFADSASREQDQPGSRPVFAWESVSKSEEDCGTDQVASKLRDVLSARHDRS